MPKFKFNKMENGQRLLMQGATILGISMLAKATKKPKLNLLMLLVPLVGSEIDFDNNDDNDGYKLIIDSRYD